MSAHNSLSRTHILRIAILLCLSAVVTEAVWWTWTTGFGLFNAALDLLAVCLVIAAFHVSQLDHHSHKAKRSRSRRVGTVVAAVILIPIALYVLIEAIVLAGW